MSVLVVGISPPLRPGLRARAGGRRRRGCAKLLRDVAACEHVTEATVIATCNRSRSTPTSTASTAASRSSPAAGRACRRATEDLLPHLYVHYDDGAVSHLFQVAPGSTRWRSARARSSARPARRCARAGAGTVGPSPQRAVPAGAPRRQARARRDRHRPGAPTLVSAALDRVGERPRPPGGRGRAPARWPPRHRDRSTPRGRRVVVVNRTPSAPAPRRGVRRRARALATSRRGAAADSWSPAPARRACS
jgi:glutamyl-tRNA reductase